MPSYAHEARVALTNREPEMILGFCRRSAVPLPSGNYLVESGPTEYARLEPVRTDSVLLVKRQYDQPDGKPEWAVIVEVQRNWEEEKLHKLPLYLVLVHDRYECDVTLVMICEDAATAQRFRKPINIGHPGWDLRPLVLGPDGTIPRVTTPEEALMDIGMAVLSVLTFGDGPDGPPIIEAVLEALDQIESERSQAYLELMAATLKGAGKLYLEEAMMTETFRFESDLSKRLRAEGEARGEARGKALGEANALLTVLAARGFEVSDNLRDKINAIQDPVQLNSLVEQAVTCTSAEALFT